MVLPLGQPMRAIYDILVALNGMRVLLKVWALTAFK